ncbi:poly(A) RNA polymerase, mitochondrial isoform X1 [Zootermopsis nevadensis]|nr:poly(A) RNA polymerase, mitochondrial isoform X1 [Zootermopsis nevadensis]
MSLLVRACFGIHIYYYNCNYVTAKLYKRTSYLLPALRKSTVGNKNAPKSSSHEGQAATQNMSFENMVESRREEACRSILVQVHSEQSCFHLHKYCCQYGEVKGMHHYSLPGSSHFVLVEFTHKANVDHILKCSSHVNRKEVIPVRSPFLWFRAPNKPLQPNHTSSEPPTPVEINGNNIPAPAELRNWIQAAESFSDQILVLHRATSLNDLGSRLRFLTARQIELALSGLFPQITVMPFGSSVNGFGKAACDLDLVLLADKEETNDEDNSDCRIVFHAKTLLTNGRTQVQRHMETLGDMVQMLLPGCSHVRRILQARVPIIKYHQDLTGVECDLSMTNMSALYMSELLYILGASDWRVRPLVFAVRSWAREIGLTNPTPGRWITNFSLTLLVLFYLQQHSKHKGPVLPTLNTMISLAGSGDHRITSEGVNCTFIRDVSQLCHHMASSSKKLPNTDNLETLFIGFFEFYSSFDFTTHAISLTNGTSVTKPDHSPMYIANPLERGLNVSKNVSHDETERLRIEFRNTAWMLESVSLTPHETSLTVSQKKADEAWGLTALFEAPQSAAKGRNIFYLPTQRVPPPRIMDVSNLFQQDTDEVGDSFVRDSAVPVNTLSSNKQQSEVQGRLKPSKVAKVSRRVHRR